MKKQLILMLFSLFLLSGCLSVPHDKSYAYDYTTVLSVVMSLCCLESQDSSDTTGRSYVFGGAGCTHKEIAITSGTTINEGNFSIPSIKND